MKSPNFMFIAGEASGDALGAELIQAIRARPEAAGAVFWGAGGPRMAAAGMHVAVDLTAHSVIGLWEVLKRYGTFKRLFDELLTLALERRPDALVCVDFSGFNRRFAAALRWEIAVQPSRFDGWRPRIVQFVSPQVWASRPGRARKMARDFDLVLSIFPFEKAWYEKHAPSMPVSFVGHPMVDRFPPATGKPATIHNPPVVLLLPGSRTGELKRHLPVLLGAAQIIARETAIRVQMVLPSEHLAAQARRHLPDNLPVDMRIGGLAAALTESDLAIASTGTVTMECAFFGVPTVTLYKTSWTTYQIARHIVTVPSLTMPNLLAGEPIFPEFIQDAATPAAIAAAALGLLRDPGQREALRKRLSAVIASLGDPGACTRAAEAIVRLLLRKPHTSAGPA